MLKKYLQALLEAFISGKRSYISNQAMPSDTVIVIATQGGMGHYIAPFDGDLVVSAESNGTMAHCWSGNSHGIRCKSESAYAAVFMPVKKGDGVNYNLGTSDQSAFVAFVKTIGSV